MFIAKEEIFFFLLLLLLIKHVFVIFLLTMLSLVFTLFHLILVFSCPLETFLSFFATFLTLPLLFLFLLRVSVVSVSIRLHLIFVFVVIAHLRELMMLRWAFLLIVLMSQDNIFPTRQPFFIFMLTATKFQILKLVTISLILNKSIPVLPQLSLSLHPSTPNLFLNMRREQKLQNTKMLSKVLVVNLFLSSYLVLVLLLQHLFLSSPFSLKKLIHLLSFPQIGLPLLLLHCGFRSFLSRSGITMLLNFSFFDSVASIATTAALDCFALPPLRYLDQNFV
jgi:hypothetical protein